MPEIIYASCYTRQEMQMLNDGNDGGERMTDYDEEPSRTAGQSHHPASTTSRGDVWYSKMFEAKRWICSSKNIDRFSRIVFPSTFVIFNVIYWSVYLSPPHFHCDLTDHGIDEPCFDTHDPVFH